MSQHWKFHTPVCLNNYLVIVSGRNQGRDIAMRNGETFERDIWMYNIYTERWHKYVIPDDENVPPQTEGACAVVFGSDIYMFGGYVFGLGETNALWKLTATPDGCFSWGEVTFQKSAKLPTLRSHSRGWEYENCLWVFGGCESSFLRPSADPRTLATYLNSHGHFQCHHDIFNNQLLCYNPSAHLWTNPECFGEVPTPRSHHVTSIIQHNAWLFGGHNARQNFEDLFQLNMLSLTWTKIQTFSPRPRICFSSDNALSSLNALSETEFVLYGENIEREDKSTSTWILDLPSQTWKKLHEMDDGSNYTTASIGVNRCIILSRNAGPTSHLRLEPKSLEQLASQIIYKHKSEISWQCLPSKMIAQLGLSLPITYNVLYPPGDSDAASTDEVQCPICMDSVSEQKDNKMTLDCGHVFCKCCIQMSFKQERTCPDHNCKYCIQTCSKQERTCPKYNCGRTYMI